MNKEDKDMYIDINILKRFYLSVPERLAKARKRLGRPLTLTEKILVAHTDNLNTQAWERGAVQLILRPDRVAMQDATAQMALLQFMQAMRKRVALPSTVHCDHLIRAQTGAKEDIERAIAENKEVYDFLSSVSKKYGIGFWGPGAGIIHQVIFENYAFPGGLMIGTDSHTPNAGGLGMLAIGVGGADAGEVMAGLTWEVLHPKLIGVRLTGRLKGWVSPKDVILYLCGLLTTKGGTNKVIEYFGPGAETISATGKGTITNMGAELGATTSIFPLDERIISYLKATDRASIAEVASANSNLLVADREVLEKPERYFDEIVEIDLSQLEPYVAGPHTPDLARPISKLAGEVKERGYPSALKVALIGSCTNSSYEDISRSAHIARQGLKAGLKAKVKFLITPGSECIYQTIKRDGLITIFEDMGGIVLANACGPCIGQWKRDDIGKNEKNSIISSFNRNFPGRNDGNTETLSFLASPEIVTAFAFAGDLCFDPVNGYLTAPDGSKVRFEPPHGDELPPNGFVKRDEGYEPPATDSDKVEIKLPFDSERLKLLEPFPRWDGKDFVQLPILIKAKGKCTTDHISPAGQWLKYRGHLDKISDNIFLGATNAFTGETGKTIDVISREKGLTPSVVARRYNAQRIGSVVIGDENYGEGSSREHAAMSPRFLGVKVVIAKSFARIHETNLKKQGILPLTLVDSGDYDKFGQDDRVSVCGLDNITPERPIAVIIHKSDGTEVNIPTRHSFTAQQIDWFKAGSALNALT